MKQKFDYPVIGTIELTALDLAFINKLFGITTELGKHPYLMATNMEMIMELAMMTALGQHCEKLITNLHDIHESNMAQCVQVQRDVAPDAAHITLGMMMAAVTTAGDPETRKEFDSLVESAFAKDKVDTFMKARGGERNAPEAGYQ